MATLTFAFNKCKSHAQSRESLTGFEESLKLYLQLVEGEIDHPDYTLGAYNSAWKVGYPITLQKFRKVVFTEQHSRANSYTPVIGVITQIASNSSMYALTVEVEI